MRRPCFRWAVRAFVCSGIGLAMFATAGCSGMGDDGGAFGAPQDPGIPGTPPSTPPPTGGKWVGVEVEGDCGRTSIAWVVVDEMCGATDDPAYLDALRSPMFRDGALIGSSLYTVDATHVWVLDVTDPAAPARQTLTAGLGHPIAVGVHAGRLLIAAGELGLVIADVSVPDDPKPTAVLALPGPALDVTVDGDRALVPMGKQGVAVIDLAPTLLLPAEPPVLVRTVQSPGFSVGVAAAGNVGFVAACETFAAVDLETGDLIGQKWIPAFDGDVLVAPAKDVAIVGSTAYVAAGRYGAVALDVTTPAQPAVLGHCTIIDDLAFYASGVRAQSGTLYVAGGEWGILPVDVATPGVCSGLGAPLLPPTPTSKDVCNPDPPWKVMPWQDVWAPPPPTPPVPQAGKDPLQTLPAGDVIYAFGDARRLGVRAVDVRSSAMELTKLGRYEEPRLVIDLAAGGGRVLAVGPAGGLFVVDAGELLAPIAAPAGLADAVAVTMLDDGRWAFATPTELRIEDAAPIALQTPPPWKGISSAGSQVAVASAEGIWVIDTELGTSSLRSSPRAELPPAVLARPEAIFMAAPEWPKTLRLEAASSQELASNGVFGAEEILDANLWREGLPRRVLADSQHGVVEIASLGARAGLTVHGSAGPTSKLALPSGTYVDAAAHGDALYLVLADRNLYRSAITTVKLGAGSAEIVEIVSFTGIATAVAADGQRLYVADADRGVRVYSLATTTPVALGVVELAAVTP
jgi:hypothetical protein